MALEKNVQDMIYLVSCAVNQKTPDKTLVESMHSDAVYDLAEKHMLSACVAFALESAGCKDARSSRIIGTALQKTMIYGNAMNSLKKAFEETDIWFMPLKGAVLKDVYPKIGMREFGDYDILFDASREDEASAVMEAQGFLSKPSGSHYHKVYRKRPYLVFEMHKALFSNLHDEKLFTYYRNIQPRLIGDGCEKRFTREDMYLYLIAHEYKHYYFSGTGLRSLLDTYVYIKTQKPDMEYVNAEAEKLGIADFEKQNRSLSLHLFGEGKLTAADLDMLDYILSSGAFGTRENRVENSLRQKKWSKLQYILDRFWVPMSKKNIKYDSFSAKYPFFYKHRTLLPVLPFYRVYEAMKSGALKAEFKAIRKAR